MEGCSCSPADTAKWNFRVVVLRGPEPRQYVGSRRLRSSPQKRVRGGTVRFNVLGRFQVASQGQICTPSAPKVRQVLAVLTLRAGQTVSIDGLIEELWEENPPKSAVTTTQTYVYQIRKAFERLEGEDCADRLLVTRPPGYALELGKEQIDATLFRDLVDQGRGLFDRGRVRQAGQVLHEALGLWSGPALTNVTCGPMLRSYATHLEEQRITALELRIAADLQLGKHRELIAELKSLVALHPLNEWLHAQLIVSLEKAGRRGEALRAYQDLRRLLNNELGLDPSADLQRLHQAVLSADTIVLHPLRPTGVVARSA
ncbi:AfsR/SARP family transcriptional regulator [Micromonospora sp. NPDC050200]|uniref:AfsR/SARP family transcriptional regulator n=1 Tax=Micromonospora sp. NPDC050200 TaxID=3155664 RepID=UPI0033C8EFDE